MKQNFIRLLLTVCFALVLAACGGGGSDSRPNPVAVLKSIAVTPQNTSTTLNATLQLTAWGTYSDGLVRDITTSVIWSTSASSVAAVGAHTGLVAASGAVATDTAVVTATSGSLTPASTTITFKASLPLFSVTDAAASVGPLTSQQWSLHNIAQTGFADAPGVANTGGTLGTDINVNPVYSTYGFTGTGVTVAVVDTGLEIAHEDLSANVVTNGSWNFVASSVDPTNTVATTGDHGTMVGGLIAMVKNTIGGLGVAPGAKLKGFNFLSAQSLANELASLGGSSSNPDSSDVAIFNQSYGTSATSDYAITAAEEDQYAYGTTNLRSGKGALYVKSAGNGFYSFGTANCTAANTLGISCQNANFDPIATLPYAIVAAALNAKGKSSSYSTAGSAIWASTPGGEFGYNAAALIAAGYNSTYSPLFDPAMVTTDQSGCVNGESVSTAPTINGPFSYFNQGGTHLSSINLNCNYTNGMNGTSSAAPMLVGVIALILEANPALTWREVKDILAKTSVQVHAAIAPVTATLGDGSYVAEQGWITNAAGRKFHNWYGFGAVNASAAVAMARTYATGSLGTFANTGWIDSGTLTLAIADNRIAGQSVSLSVPKVGASGRVEAVQIKVTTSATGGSTGNLGIELTSPSGTKSILKNIRDGFNASYLSGMVLASNAFYGETGTGTWTIKVLDGQAGGGNQTLKNVKIRVYGH